jgi:hypothetical protein
MKKTTWAIFWALIAVFAVNIVLPGLIQLFGDLLDETVGKLFASSSMLLLVVFSLLGVALLVFTVREKAEGKLKKFLLLTGASAAGVAAFGVLHNLVYGLAIHFFGADFWNNGDEPFFFLLAIIVCPIGFLVGAIGSLVLHFKQKNKGHQEEI